MIWNDENHSSFRVSGVLRAQNWIVTKLSITWLMAVVTMINELLNPSPRSSFVIGLLMQLLSGKRCAVLHARKPASVSAQTNPASALSGDEMLATQDQLNWTALRLCQTNLPTFNKYKEHIFTETWILSAFC